MRDPQAIEKGLPAVERGNYLVIHQLEDKMETSTAVVIGMAASGLAAIAVLAVYRLWQRKRVRQVEGWVKDYLCARYGELPNPLSINCSDDPLWPVLVAFNTPGTGIRCSLHFSCAHAHSTFALLSEKDAGPGAGQESSH